MPKLSIDNREVEVPAGATILDAARKLGIDVPTLCYLDGCRPSTSCLVCMVRVRGGRLVPACATAAADGMEVESETDEVHQVRKTALELLLSDHVGDCLAPCWFGCPAHMDIPRMLRQIAAGELREAIVTVKNDIALPAVLGRVCPKPCEKVCRRSGADGAVVICELKRYVADVDLVSNDPYLPELPPPTGRRVAIIGGGPTGLSAAYYLRRSGHAVAIFDDQPALGGRLRHETSDLELPRDVLDAEIAQITRLDVEQHLNTPVSAFSSQLSAFSFDAVLIACGAVDKQKIAELHPDLKATGRGIEVERTTYQTNLDGVFAAGNAIRGKGMVIRSVADGKEAAQAVDRWLAKRAGEGPEKPFNSKIGKVSEAELQVFLGEAANETRKDLPPAFATLDEDAPIQAARCMHCDCRALADCKLRHYAAKYDANPGRYAGQRAPFEQDARHADVIYEPGKCINCGLCIEIASQAGESLGLTFVGRGFDVRVGVPFHRSLAEALAKVAAECVAACPTAALAWKDSPPKAEQPDARPQ